MLKYLFNMKEGFIRILYSLISGIFSGVILNKKQNNQRKEFNWAS